MRTLWFLPIVSICSVSILSFLSAVLNELPPCFTVSAANCTSLKNGAKCDKIDDLSSQSRLIFCCNVTSEKEILGYLQNFKADRLKISGFHMRDSALPILNANIFNNELKTLTSLAITDSNISRINGIFDNTNGFQLSCLNISNNAINDDFHPQLIVNQTKLMNIIMANNKNMTMLPYLPNINTFQLDISGNEELLCTYVIDLTFKLIQKHNDFTYVNQNSTVCTPPNEKKIFFNNKEQYHVKYQVTWTQLKRIKEIYMNCPSVNATINCTCSVATLDNIENKDIYVYRALVNCSNLNLKSLPPTLPTYTKILDVSNNNITSLEGIGNSSYNTLKELYADNNKIITLRTLEGTPFIYNFMNLSLKENKIDQIPDYMFTNVFDRNSGMRVNLGKNELKCNCLTASQTKRFLKSNMMQIPDYEEIYSICDGTRVPVIYMSQKERCASPADWKDYVRYIIVAEVSLFVLLIGKVSYDYYIFKTFGYLPWPASKMPKLPCDWCFET